MKHAFRYHTPRASESPTWHGSGFKTGCLSPLGRAGEGRDTLAYTDRWKRMSGMSGSKDGLVRRVREVLSRPFQALPVIDLLGLVDRFPEGHRPAVLGDLLEPGSPAVSEHEPTPNRVKSSLLGLPR